MTKCQSLPIVSVGAADTILPGMYQDLMFLPRKFHL